jgi:hypothetical protein
MLASMDIPDEGRRCRDDDVDPDWWVEDDLPEGTASEHVAASRDEQIRAQLLCYECPFLRECREAAWSEPAHVWGGLSYGERYKARVAGKVVVPPRRPLRDRSVKVLAKVRQQYLAGATTEDIAANMNLTLDRVRYHIRTLLIETRIFRERTQAWGTPPPFRSTMTQAAFRSGLGTSPGSLRDSA